MITAMIVAYVVGYLVCLYLLWGEIKYESTPITTAIALLLYPAILILGGLALLEDKIRDSLAKTHEETEETEEAEETYTKINRDYQETFLVFGEKGTADQLIEFYEYIQVDSQKTIEDVLKKFIDEHKDIIHLSYVSNYEVEEFFMQETDKWASVEKDGDSKKTVRVGRTFAPADT